MSIEALVLFGSLMATLLAGGALLRAETPTPCCPGLRGEMSATLYGTGPRARQVLYRWRMQYVDRDPNHWRSEFLDPGGSVAAEDEMHLREGQLESYRYVRYTSGERAEVRVSGNKVLYRQDWEKKSRHAEEPFTSNFVTGPYLVVYILQNWDALARGKTLKVRFGVPDLLGSYEFRLARELRNSKEGQPVVIKMAASSFLVSLFVRPVLLEFSAEEKILRRIVGRTLPVEKRGKEILAVDADLRVEQQDRNLSGR